MGEQCRMDTVLWDRVMCGGEPERPRAGEWLGLTEWSSLAGKSSRFILLPCDMFMFHVHAPCSIMPCCSIDITRIMVGERHLQTGKFEAAAVLLHGQYWV